MGIAGQIPPVLGWLSGLRILVLAVNQLTGEIPRELGTLSGLRIIDLSDNNLAGAIPPELGAPDAPTLPLPRLPYEKIGVGQDRT